MGVPVPAPLPSPSPPPRSPHLMEKQGLADVTPAAGASSSREQGRKQAHEKQGAASGPRADEEHHEQAGGHPQQARVPGEEAEGGAGGRHRRKEARGCPDGEPLHSIPSLRPPGPRPPHSSLPFSGDTGISFAHRKLGAEAHSRLRQDRSTAA